MDHFDNSVHAWVQAHHQSTLDNFLAGITFVGSYPIMLLFAILCVGFMMFQKEYQKAAVVFCFVFTSLFVAELMKSFIGRPRPVVMEPLVPVPIDNSFPCEQALIATTFYLIICQALNVGQRGYLITASIFLSLLIGVSKVYIGLNYASDVIVSWVIGSIFGVAYHFINSSVERWNQPKRRSTDLCTKSNGH